MLTKKIFIYFTEKNIHFMCSYLKYASVLSHFISNYIISIYIFVNFKSSVFYKK